MNVKDIVRRNILLYPTVMQNVIDVLTQVLLTIGGSYQWLYGEIVGSPYTINKNRRNKIPTVEEALIINEKRKESELKNLDKYPKQHRTAVFESIQETSREDEMIIRNIENRVNDYSLEKTIKRRDRLRINISNNLPTPIFSLNFEWDNLSKIPVDVTEDWLDACKFLYKTLSRNPQLIFPEYIEKLPMYKRKLDSIKEQRYIKKEDIRPGMILQLYNKAENNKDRVVVLKVKEKHIKKGLAASRTGLYGFRGLWYGNHPDNPNCYGKIYDLSFYNEDEIELIRPDITGLDCETIKFITK